VQGEGMRTCGELKLVGHRSSEDDLEEKGDVKIETRDAGVTDAQARQYTSVRREDCWEDGHGRGELFS